MPKTPIDFSTIRKIGLALPGVEESAVFGAPALKVNGKLLACIPANRSAEPGSLMVRMDFADRTELLAEDPGVYYVTDHYAGYNAVLVRLARIKPGVLRDLLGMAHKFVTRQTVAKKTVAKKAVTKKTVAAKAVPRSPRKRR